MRPSVMRVMRGPAAECDSAILLFSQLYQYIGIFRFVCQWLQAARAVQRVGIATRLTHVRVCHDDRMHPTTARLSTNQAAEYLGIPTATLRWFRHIGDRGPRSYALTPRHVVYDLADLQQWEGEQKAMTQRGGVRSPAAESGPATTPRA